MVFEDDAVRANRIVEKFNISAVKSASITNEVEEIKKNSRQEKHRMNKRERSSLLQKRVQRINY